MNPLMQLNKRIAWANRQKDEPMWPSGPTPQQYLDGMVRTTGSYIMDVETMKDLKHFFSKLEEATWIPPNLLPRGIATEGNKYYQTKIPIVYSGWVNMGQVSQLEEHLDQIRVVKSDHGIELQLSGQEPTQTEIVSFIVDDDGLVTWYPGPFTAKQDLSLATVKFVR